MDSSTTSAPTGPAPTLAVAASAIPTKGTPRSVPRKWRSRARHLFYSAAYRLMPYPMYVAPAIYRRSEHERYARAVTRRFVRRNSFDEAYTGKWSPCVYAAARHRAEVIFATWRGLAATFAMLSAAILAVLTINVAILVHTSRASWAGGGPSLSAPDAFFFVGALGNVLLTLFVYTRCLVRLTIKPAVAQLVVSLVTLPICMWLGRAASGGGTTWASTVAVCYLGASASGAIGGVPMILMTWPIVGISRRHIVRLGYMLGCLSLELIDVLCVVELQGKKLRRSGARLNRIASRATEAAAFMLAFHFFLVALEQPNKVMRVRLLERGERMANTLREISELVHLPSTDRTRARMQIADIIRVMLAEAWGDFSISKAANEAPRGAVTIDSAIKFGCGSDGTRRFPSFRRAKS